MRIVIVALALLAAVVLAGCKDFKNKSAPSSQPATQAAPDLTPIDQPGKYGLAGQTPATTAARDAKLQELTAANRQLQAQLQDRQKQLDAARKSLTQGDTDTREAMAGMQAEIDLLKSNNESLRTALDLVAAAQKGPGDAKDQLAVQFNDALKAADKLNQDNQRLREARKAERDQLVAAFDELEKTRQAITSNNKNAQDAIARLQGENQQLAATNDALMQSLDRAKGSGRESGKGSMVTQLEDARKTCARLNEENKRLADQLAADAEQDKKQDKAIRQLTADVAERNGIIRELQKKLGERDKPDSSLLQKLADRDKRIADLITQVAQLERQLKDLLHKPSDRDDSDRPERRGLNTATPATTPAPMPASAPAAVPSPAPKVILGPSVKPVLVPSSTTNRRGQ